jgi:hypothetical protein
MSLPNEKRASSSLPKHPFIPAMEPTKQRRSAHTFITDLLEPIGRLISFDRSIIQPETITGRIIANAGQPKTDPGDSPRVGKDFVGVDVLLVIFQVEEEERGRTLIVEQGRDGTGSGSEKERTVRVKLDVRCRGVCTRKRGPPQKWTG